jgi:FkbM family methyltransferase
MRTEKALTRLATLANGLVRFANPFQVMCQRTLNSNGVMTISDRHTGVTLEAATASYGMFRETWHYGDYDVAACPIRKGDVVVDIGANQGFYTCYAAQRGAKVFAYEPSPESCQRLRDNVKRNGFDSHVEIREAAVGAQDGTARLFCSDFLGGGANTTIADHAQLLEQRGARYDGGQEVRMVAFKDVLQQCGPIRIVKMDCEGAELSLIKEISEPGLIDSLAMEFHPRLYRLEELAQTIRGWGTHQVSFAKSAYILYAVRTEILLGYTRDIDEGRLPAEPVRPYLG